MASQAARKIIALCDFMNGYIGQEITQAFVCALVMVPSVFAFLLSAVFLSR